MNQRENRVRLSYVAGEGETTFQLKARTGGQERTPFSIETNVEGAIGREAASLRRSPNQIKKRMQATLPKE